MNRLPIQPDLTPTQLFNPSFEDFVFEYDKQNTRQTYVLPAYGLETFPKYIADKIASRLADKILGKRSIVNNYELDKQEVLAEIYVT